MGEDLRFFELNTGAKIPSVGLGTWLAEPGVVADALATAIKVAAPFTRTCYLFTAFMFLYLCWNLLGVSYDHKNWNIFFFFFHSKGILSLFLFVSLLLLYDWITVVLEQRCLTMEIKWINVTLMSMQVGYRHIDCAQIYGNEKEVRIILATHLTYISCPAFIIQFHSAY